MLKDFLDWCGNLAAKDVLNPAIGLIVGVFGMHLTRSQLARGAQEKVEAARTAATAAHMAADVATADSLTRRFQLLMDGYERRIDDLTAQVENLSAEVVKLREELKHARTR